MLLCLLLLIVQPESTQFISARYGLSLTLPAGWEILERERDDRIFLAGVSTPDARASAALLCELALAPESLHEWRTRIQKQADTGRIAGLQRNEVVKTPKGERLDTLIEFRPDPDTLFVEHTIRLVAHRQLYSFQLRADSNAYARVRPQFDALIESLAFTPPQTGTKAIDPDKNRWEQTEYKFALNLPQGWQPVLAPAEVALFYATAPAQGIWSDNCLVIARPRSETSLDELEHALPGRIQREDPGCEILQCKQVKRDGGMALETIVRTRRGPFSMTILERRFTGQRFDYEVKYTVETKRFDANAARFRESLDSFEELPGAVPGAGKSA